MPDSELNRNMLGHLLFFPNRTRGEDSDEQKHRNREALAHVKLTAQAGESYFS